jgi:hypothetical protein
MFSFTPPKGAMDISPRRCFIGGGGGGGFSGGEGKKQIACRSAHNWDGDTLVEQSRWTFRGHEIVLQRRFTLSDDEKHVQIAERIIGPKEETERTVSVPVG